MKLVETGDKLNQRITCDNCGSVYYGSHIDEGVKERDYDYTMRPPTYRYYFTCQVCKDTVEFNRKASDNGDK